VLRYRFLFEQMVRRELRQKRARRGTLAA